jgi:hypothetical protein
MTITLADYADRYPNIAVSRADGLLEGLATDLPR